MMKKILFPTDFSKVSENAFRFAIEIANDMGARLDIVNVFQVPFSNLDVILPHQVDEMVETEKIKVEKKMEAFIKRVTSNFRGNKLFIYGVLMPEEIIAEVKKSLYDLVILGTEGERNPLEKLLGSATTRIMMNGPCPILVIPQDAKYKGRQNIAYASNFRPADSIAIEQLMNFSGNLEANLNFVHVDTDTNIGQVKNEIDSKNYPFKFSDFSIINSPTIMEGLDNYIEKRKVDILAFLIPKRGLWERLFHQSFTKKYAFHTKVPMLIFKE